MVVVAPIADPAQTGDRIEFDRRDAINLAKLHRAGELEDGLGCRSNASGNTDAVACPSGPMCAPCARRVSSYPVSYCVMAITTTDRRGR